MHLWRSESTVLDGKMESFPFLSVDERIYISLDFLKSIIFDLYKNGTSEGLGVVAAQTINQS